MSTIQQYKIEVTFKDDWYSLYIPDFCLVVRDRDIGAAYAAAEREVDLLKSRYVEAGIDDQFPQPGAPKPSLKLDSALVNFAVRSVIIGCVIVGVVAGTAFAVRENVPELRSRHVADAVHRLATRIENLTPEKREQLRKDLQIIGKEIGVFTRALSDPSR